LAKRRSIQALNVLDNGRLRMSPVERRELVGPAGEPVDRPARNLGAIALVSSLASLVLTVDTMAL